MSSKVLSKLRIFSLAILAGYISYLVLPIKAFAIDNIAIKYLASIFGHFWIFLPITILGYLLANERARCALLLLSLTTPSISIILSRSSFQLSTIYGLRPVVFAYITPLVIALCSLILIYFRGSSRKLWIALLSSLLIIASISYRYLYTNLSLDRILNLSFNEGGALLGLFNLTIVAFLGEYLSVTLLILLSVLLIYIILSSLYSSYRVRGYEREEISRVKDSRVKDSTILKGDSRAKVKRKRSGLDNIFKVTKPDWDFKDRTKRSVDEKRVRLEELLGEYGIEAKVLNTLIGPAITRFELSVARGTRVKKVSALSDDIAMNLEAKSVRIEAPIPGKNAIGIEIPNDVVADVSFGALIRKKDRKNHLNVVLGKSIVGEDILVDLRKMPHLLVAGRTGAGKSVGINVMIASILYTASPQDVKFIMIDPKMVELMPYNGIPHLYVPVITDPKIASTALGWAVQEMERRYRLLADSGVRHLDSYNAKSKSKIPYLVIVIDELADLMMVAPADIETSIARIAQKARAVGIHLVVATQRPSIDVITGTIKANLPSRISFAVTSQIDSRTILDSQGAEKLLGRGDLLFLESGRPNLIRIQGAYISDDEINRFADYLRSKGAPEYNSAILEAAEVIDRDPLYEQALDIIRSSDKASTTLIQRKLKIGYSRAARIMDQLEEEGVIRIGSKGEKELVKD